VREGCDDRSVKKLTRTFVYVRPSLLVIDDRIGLERGKDGVTWAAHVTKEPVVAGNLSSAVIGRSRVDVRTLEPSDARIGFVKEPNGSGDGPHRTNQHWGPMWRIEVASPRGAPERGFLHYISVDDAKAAPPPARALSGDGLRGAAGSAAGKRAVVLFAAKPEGGSVALDEPSELVVVAGLDPGKSYEVDVDPGARCTLRVKLGKRADALVATGGGFVRLSAARCARPR
jgi:hypothetical protein